MEFLYAQLNESGICTGLSQLNGAVDRPDMIPLTAEVYTPDLIGRKYEDGQWGDKAADNDPPPTTEVARLWAAIGEQETASTDLQKKLTAQQTVLASGMGMQMDLTLAELAGITFDAVGEAPVVKAEDGVAWQAGIYYEAGLKVVFGGVEYRVLVTHLSQDGWKPDAPGVYLFERIVQTLDDWVANVFYAVGDRVTYEEKIYECISQHLSQDGWYPGAPGVYLWQAVSE
jgi:hypothetical protein